MASLLAGVGQLSQLAKLCLWPSPPNVTQTLWSWTSLS